jgi:hypothetical protein
MSVRKRKRELEKAEKAAIKRERRFQKSSAEEDQREAPVATRDDLEGYGVLPSAEGDDD